MKLSALGLGMIWFPSRERAPHPLDHIPLLFEHYGFRSFHLANEPLTL